MEMTIYRDFLAIRFIRCLATIPGTELQAGGAGITLDQAIVRCESEVIEREFHIHELEPQKIRPVGIAAHFDYSSAHEKALQEVIETLCLDQIYAEKKVSCRFYFKIGSITFGIAKTSHGYFSIIRGALGKIPVCTYAAKRRPLSSILKAWEEFQSIRYFKPESKHLKNFTKANKLFSETELRDLPFKFERDSIYTPDLSTLGVRHTERSGRTIVYYVKSNGGN